jgi:Protein of unknown function DUF86
MNGLRSGWRRRVVRSTQSWPRWLLVCKARATQPNPDDQRMRHPMVPWLRRVRLRDGLAHGSIGLDEEMVWRTVIGSVPALAEPGTAVATIELKDPG